MVPEGEDVEEGGLVAEKACRIEGKGLQSHEMLIDEGLEEDVHDHLFLYELKPGLLNIKGISLDGAVTVILRHLEEGVDSFEAARQSLPLFLNVRQVALIHDSDHPPGSVRDLTQHLAHVLHAVLANNLRILVHLGVVPEPSD